MSKKESTTQKVSRGVSLFPRRNRNPEITREALNSAMDEYFKMGGGITKIDRDDVIPATSKAYPQNYWQTEGPDNDDSDITNYSSQH